ncbi:MAG: hypothetical protein J5950_06820 [Clostridia bacterium]|nr:hypothetical protein [Clostridia bacterium]
MTKIRRIKILVAAVLTIAMALSMFACKKAETPKETHIYENRYINQRFYYSQGYPDDWTFSAGDDQYQLADLNTYGNTEGYLCAKFFPKDSGYNGDVSFTVYKYNTNSMMNTLNGITENLMNQNSVYYLNDIFVEEDLQRDSFTFTTDWEPEKPNHFQWNTANYKFVRDGEDWNGKFYISTGNNTWFFLICMETKVEKWDANLETFGLMMSDFGFEGFEKSDE